MIAVRLSKFYFNKKRFDVKKTFTMKKTKTYMDKLMENKEVR